MFENDNTWYALLYAAIITVIVLIIIAVVADHEVREYTLDGDIDTSSLVIKADRDWAGDYTIRLDRDVTYDEAIELINELNKTLK